MRFTDFVNKYRIDHIIENFNSNDINTYTLESLAKQSGFSSKSSFYRAFNKVHNCTPLEYFNSK
jgi:AraC-like DNA-binding protein